MADTEFSAFNRLPPEIRVQIWEEALGNTPCLHAFCSQVVETVSGALWPRKWFYYDHRYCQSDLGYISPEPSFKPELNLRLVNQEARGVVDRHHKDIQRIYIAHQRVDEPVVVKVDTQKDMLYPMNLNHFVRALNRPLIRNFQISLGLRHLALPIFDIAYWPDKNKQQLHDPSTHSTHSPWLLPGLSVVLNGLRSLESIRLVVGRLFSVPFGVPYRRVKRQEISGSVALITTRTQLRDLAKSQARDAYGFSDYTAFVDTGGYQWPIDFPRKMFQPSDQANPTPLPGPSETPTELPFGTYDPFFRQVLGELRRLTSPPLYPYRTVDVKLVVDLDSNANGAGSLMRPRDYREDISFMDRHENDEALRYGEYRDELVPGYDRYFANLNNVLEWYEDVSGHARSIKGYENATEAERNADDPDFEPPEADLDNLSDGSGPDSLYGYRASKKKKRKPRAANSKTTMRKTTKPVEESDEDSEYVPPDYSEDDSPSD